MKPLRSQWRTVIVALGGMLIALAGLALCGKWTAALSAYPAFCGVLVAGIGSQAWKSSREHAANAASQ